MTSACKNQRNPVIMATYLFKTQISRSCYTTNKTIKAIFVCMKLNAQNSWQDIIGSMKGVKGDECKVKMLDLDFFMI